MAVEVGMPRELSISSIISELYLKYLDNRRKRRAEKRKGEVIVVHKKDKSVIWRCYITDLFLVTSHFV